MFGVDHLVGIAPGAFDLELHPAGNSRSVAGTGIRRPVIRPAAGEQAVGNLPGIAVVRRFGLGRQFGFDEAQRSDLVGRQALALGAVALDADEFVDVDLVRGTRRMRPLVGDSVTATRSACPSSSRKNCILSLISAVKRFM